MQVRCLCGNKEFKEIGWKDERQVVECVGCGHWYVLEIPDDYLEMYKGDWYQNQHQIDIGHLPYDHRYWRDYEIAIGRLDKIREFRMPQKLLDVGCANGAFVRCARVRGFDAYGLDLAESTSQIKNCYIGNIQSEPSEFWGIVTLHDVIEHAVDPLVEIYDLWRTLKTGGMLVIEAPDFSCEDFRVNGLHWKHVRPIEHIHMMTPALLEELLEERGFNVIEVTHPIPGKYGMYAEKG